MSIIVVLGRMLMLFAMMVLGFAVYKLNWVDDNGYKQLSKIVVNIFNPALIINGAITAIGASAYDSIKENLLVCLLYFVILISISYLLVLLLGTKQSHKNVYQLMTIFSNVGFMGIPVITSILGQGCVIYITFYILTYNIILYTYGIYLAQRNKPKEERISGLSGVVNPGVICSVVAIVLYASRVELNETVLKFFDYVGNATVPLSMIIIGISVAKMPFKQIFGGVRLYIFSVVKMLVIPIGASFIFRGIISNQTIFSVFVLMLAMPVGSIVTMITKEYGDNETLCSRGIIITTLASIITIPIVSAFL